MSDSPAAPPPPAATLSFDEFKARAYFDPLDGLRALSIFLVLFHHVPRVADTSWLRTLQENGRYGVSFFFVISGFLICTLLLREEEHTGRINLWKFYGRRALRLLPVYYVALLLQAILVFALHQHTPEHQAMFREKLPSYLFYYSNWLPTATQGPFFCAWSLAVEEQFYLVFGLLLLLAGRRLIIVAAIIALVVKALTYGAFGTIDASSTLWRVVFSYQEAILLGVLLAFAMHRPAGYSWLARRLGSPWILTGAGLALVFWICGHPMRTQSSWDAQLLYLLMTAVLAALIVRPRATLLNHPFLVHVGRISYGIYLFHMFVISIAKKLPGGTSPWLCFAASSAVVIVVASLVYAYFESPIIRYYKDRFSPLRKQRPSGPPPLETAPIPSLSKSGTGG